MKAILASCDALKEKQDEKGDDSSIVGCSMREMQRSMKTIEAISPNVKEMAYTINRMTWVMDQRMGMMNNGMDRVGDRLSPPGMMMSFNW